jgi:hypothetical protein
MDNKRVELIPIIIHDFKVNLAILDDADLQ